MTPSTTSLKVHKIVEFIKSFGFDLETDDLEEYEIQELLQDLYGIHVALTGSEEDLLRQELHTLANLNEMREAQVKGRELFPEDHGTVCVRGISRDSLYSGDSWPVYFHYPVDRVLKEIPIQKPGSKNNQQNRQTAIDQDEASKLALVQKAHGISGAQDQWRLKMDRLRGFFSRPERSPYRGVQLGL